MSDHRREPSFTDPKNCCLCYVYAGSVYIAAADSTIILIIAKEEENNIIIPTPYGRRKPLNHGPRGELHVWVYPRIADADNRTGCSNSDTLHTAVCRLRVNRHQSITV